MADFLNFDAVERGAAQKKITKVNDRTGAPISSARLNVSGSVHEAWELDQTSHRLGENSGMATSLRGTSVIKSEAQLSGKAPKTPGRFGFFAGFPIRFQFPFQKFSKMSSN